jgi:hypothetical protein
VIVTGDEYARFIEMGGRDARDRLALKLPSFGAPPKPARRTESLLNEARAQLTAWRMQWVGLH